MVFCLVLFAGLSRRVLGPGSVCGSPLTAGGVVD
jgi:hypothetical protein